MCVCVAELRNSVSDYIPKWLCFGNLRFVKVVQACYVSLAALG